MPRFFGSFIPNLGDLNSRLRGCGTRVISDLFFQNLLEDKDRRLETTLTLSLILWVNLKLRGLLHMECEFNRTPYKRLDNYSEHEHLTASTQSRKYSEDTFKTKFARIWRRLQKYSDACSTRLWRARGLVRPGHTGLSTWHTSPRIQDGTWPTPYICCGYS
jgi:hypothetical protein